MTELASTTVKLMSVPIDLWRRASAHQEAVQREFDIIRVDLPPDSAPNRLSALVDEFDSRYAGTTAQTWDELHAAAERGDAQIDLVFTVPPEAAEAARQLDRILNDVDDFCRSGEHLLTLATPSDQVALRTWFLGEFTRQIDQGLDPAPWTHEGIEEHDDEVIDGRPVSSAVGDSEPIYFEGDLDLASASALRDKILDRRAAGVSNLILDLTGVKFMDSVGISLLVSAHNRAVDDGTEITVLLPERLRSLIEMSGLIEVLSPEFVAADSQP